MHGKKSLVKGKPLPQELKWVSLAAICQALFLNARGAILFRKADRASIRVATVSLKFMLVLSILSHGLVVRSAIAAPTDPQTYYVDAALGNDANDGLSVASPWKSIAAVNAHEFAAGSSILLKRGESWSEKLLISSSGTSADAIVFGAYGNGANPILSGDGTRDNLIYGRDRHYIVIQDIDILGWTDRGVWNDGGDGWVIQRLNVEGGDSQEPDHGIRFSNTNGRKISGGLITDNQIRTIGTVENAAIFFQGIMVQGVDGTIIRSNTVNTENAGSIWVGSGSGVANNTNVLVEGNLIYGCTSGIQLAYTNASVIQHNVVRDGKGFGVGIAFRSDNVTVQGNVIYNMTYFLKPDLFNGIDISNDSHNGKVYHNTVARVARHSLVLAQDGGIDLRGWDIRNNIFDARGNVGIPANPTRMLPIGIRNATAYAEDNDLFVSRNDGYVASVGYADGTLVDIENYRQMSGQGASSIDADPKFVNPDNGNFNLQPNSPAIGMGDRDVGLELDITGAPYNNPPSAGAIEFGVRPLPPGTLAVQ